MNAAEAQEVKHFLLQSHDQYRELAERHHALDDRLHELTEQALPLRLQNKSKKSPSRSASSPSRIRWSRSRPTGSASITHDILTRTRAPPVARRRTWSIRRAYATMSGPRAMRIDPAGWPFVIGAGSSLRP